MNKNKALNTITSESGNQSKRVSAFLLGAAFVLCFAAASPMTAQIAVADQPTVFLGSAATFVVLGGETVTNTGPSVITGDLGVWPGTAYVPGTPPATVIGSIHAGDIVAQHAQASLTIAYNNAAGRKLGVVGVAGDLGGRTLTPGLYKSTSTMAITGDLTLDATGHPNSIFIFQVASKLTVGTGSRVVLTGGAKASNVFWQVGSSATLGTFSAFKGTIMAHSSISIATSATLHGRALAQHGSVTLDSNVITKN